MAAGPAMAANWSGTERAATTTTTAPTTTTTRLRAPLRRPDHYPTTTTTTTPTEHYRSGATGGGASDNFARANGSLGPNWADMADGGLTIVNQQVQGTSSSSYSGDIRTAETYASDQSSQVQLTVHPAHRQPVGRPRRARPGRRGDLYVGLYFWNFGSPELMLFLRER